MGKVFYLLMLSFNPDFSVTHEYMGGHTYQTATGCNAVAIAADTAVDVTRINFACTTIGPEIMGTRFKWSKRDTLANETFLIKVE